MNVSFLKGARRFCDVAVYSGGMRVRLLDPYERAVKTVSDVDGLKPLICASFEAA